MYGPSRLSYRVFTFREAAMILAPAVFVALNLNMYA